MVLGPRGGGTTRRRASDAFRFGLAVAVVAVTIPVMRDNSAVELGIVHFLNPPPAAIRWLVTAAFWLGSVGVIVCLAAFALLVPRLAAVRWVAVAAASTWAVCALLRVALGPDARARHCRIDWRGHQLSGHPASRDHQRGGHRAALPEPGLSPNGVLLVLVAAFAAVVDGSALPVNAVSSLAIGWGVAALLHLAAGSPLGLPSAEEVSAGIADLDVAVDDIVRAANQVWGVERFGGRDPTATRSSCPCTAATLPMPACWPSSGAFVSTGIQDPRSSLTGFSRSSTRRTWPSWRPGPGSSCQSCSPSAGSGQAGTP